MSERSEGKMGRRMERHLEKLGPMLPSKRLVSPFFENQMNPNLNLAFLVILC
jgi:hypothetical protein